MKKILIVSVAVLLFSSCGGVKNKRLEYNFLTIDHQSVGCEPERDACFIARLDYPNFHTGDSMAVFLANRIIRNSTLDYLGLGNAEDVDVLSLDKAVLRLEESFQKVKTEQGMATGWQAEMDTKELYRDDTVLVLETRMMTYVGGAHPTTNTRYFNFDRRSGRLIPLNSFVNLKTFTTMAGQTFKDKYLQPGQQYSDANFSFIGSKYQLPANYAFLGDSIRLHYNRYEIAPYAAGEFEVTVPVK